MVRLHEHPQSYLGLADKKEAHGEFIPLWRELHGYPPKELLKLICQRQIQLPRIMILQIKWMKIAKFAELRMVAKGRIGKNCISGQEALLIPAKRALWNR